LIEQFRLIVVMLSPVELCKIVQTVTYVGMVRTERLLPSGQSAAKLRFSLVESSLVMIENRQIVDGSHGVGMVRPADRAAPVSCTRVSRDRGDLAEARRLYQEAADIFRRQGERWGMARSSTDLGYLACDQDDPATARSLFGEALAIFLELGHKRGLAKVLEGLACLAAHQDNPERALRLAGAASSLRQTIGAPRRSVEQAKLEATLVPAWQGDSATTKAMWADGWRMRLDDALQYAVDGPR
jgi:hypothetical protein